MERQQSIKERLGWASRPRQNHHTANPRTARPAQNKSNAVQRNKNQPRKAPVKNNNRNQANNNNRRPTNQGRVTKPSRKAPNVVSITKPAEEDAVSMFVTVPLYLFNRRFTAAVDCFTGRTKIGKELAELAISNDFAQKTKLVTFGGTEKRVQYITIHMGTRITRLKPVDCVIDDKIPPRGIIIGLRALASIGYRLQVDGVLASHHESRRQVRPHQQASIPMEIPEEPFQEEAFIDALSEAEIKEILGM